MPNPAGQKPLPTKPPPPTVEQRLEALEASTQRTHRLLEQHVAEEREERAARRLRYDGIMSLLQHVLEKLPSSTD